MEKIIFLYSRINGFVISTLLNIVNNNPGIVISIIYWDNAKSLGNEYELDIDNRIKLIRRSDVDDIKLLNIIEDNSPKIVYISGWMDAGYIKAIRRAKRRGSQFVTVCGIDDQWFGSVRQYMGAIYFRLYFKKIYDYMWVAGKPQYHYARMMGYGPDRILSNLLSADLSKFDQRTDPRRRFLFVGRFDAVKGLDTLIAAHESLSEAERAEWPLVLIGDGKLRDFVTSKESDWIQVYPYLQPEALADELALGGVGLMTSTFEAWSVALHEMASMGYPLIVSRQCGAASEFLIHGYNGFSFDGGNVAGLAAAMQAMIAKTDDERAAMGQASAALAQRITPELSARSLLSLLVSPPLPG